MDFLKENWLFILGPLFFLLIALALYMIFGGGEQPAEFQYDI